MKVKQINPKYWKDKTWTEFKNQYKGKLNKTPLKIAYEQVTGKKAPESKKKDEPQTTGKKAKKT